MQQKLVGDEQGSQRSKTEEHFDSQVAIFTSIRHFRIIIHIILLMTIASQATMCGFLAKPTDDAPARTSSNDPREHDT